MNLSIASEYTYIEKNLLINFGYCSRLQVGSAELQNVGKVRRDRDRKLSMLYYQVLL